MAGLFSSLSWADNILRSLKAIARICVCSILVEQLVHMVFHNPWITRGLLWHAICLEFAYLSLHLRPCDRSANFLPIPLFSRSPHVDYPQLWITPVHQSTEQLYEQKGARPEQHVKKQAKTSTGPPPVALPKNARPEGKCGREMSPQSTAGAVSTTIPATMRTRKMAAQIELFAANESRADMCRTLPESARQ